MCSDCLVLRDNPSTFEVLHLCKYFQNFIKYIGIDIAISSFFTGWLGKMSWWQYQFQYILRNSENIYIDLKPQKSMGRLSTLNNRSTWCQVFSKLQKSPKLVETTLTINDWNIRILISAKINKIETKLEKVCNTSNKYGECINSQGAGTGLFSEINHLSTPWESGCALNLYFLFQASSNASQFMLSFQVTIVQNI